MTNIDDELKINHNDANSNAFKTTTNNTANINNKNIYLQSQDKTLNNTSIPCDANDDSCVISNSNDEFIPKIALLFLTNEPMHNEPIWRAFFEEASKLNLKVNVPKPNKINLSDVVHGSLKPSVDITRRRLKNDENTDASNKKDVCNEEEYILDTEVDRLMSDEYENKDIISKQNLFNVYVHPRPNYSFPNTSIFHGYEIKNRIDNSNAFAQFTLVEAEIELIKAALKDPNNRKFMVLSESCVPLHRPEVIHAQILAERRSRVDACRIKGHRRDVSRWVREMETDHLKLYHWRKSPQWVALTRAHAELVVADQHVKNMFKKHCYTSWQHICVADEHYIPTLLGSYSLDLQTDCRGFMTSTEWHGRDWHPITYSQNEINIDLINRLANSILGTQCDLEEARLSVGHVYDGFQNNSRCLKRDLTTLVKPSVTNWVLKNGYHPLRYSCPMFARKFPKEFVKDTLKALLVCNGAALGNWC